MSIEAYLAKLEKVRKANHRSDRWYACCPCHNDEHPSLCITKKDDKILIYCFACGANGKDVSEAIGVNTYELFKQAV
jgi:DNA primase